MKALQCDMVAIDFEGTGAVPGFPNEPWQVGMVLISRGEVMTARSCNRLLRIDADRPFNPHAPGLHHQLRGELATAPTLAELWPEMKEWWLGHPLVAHNIGTERTFIHQAAPMHTFGPWIDTLTLSRHVYPQLASHSLEDLIDHLGLGDRVCRLCPGLLPHDAWFDAVACAVLLQHFLSLPGWEQVTVEGLAHVKSTDYHRRQAAKSRRPRRP